MYRPAAFRIEDLDELHDLLACGPAHLVTSGPDGIDSTVVPFVLDRSAGPSGTLRGHLARANPQWRSVPADGCPALAIVAGPDAYVSPSWYPTKHVDGRVVPTWNYVVVHAHGTLRTVEDPAWLAEQVRGLTERHEAGRDEPWAVDDAPEDYVRARLAGIVGVELTIERLEGTAKLSQNRPADHDAVATALGAGSPRQQEVAELMRRRRPAS